MIKSRRMRWSGHVASMEVSRGIHLFSFLRERDNVEDPGIDGRIILRWIYRKCDGDMDWIDLAQERDRWLSFLKVVMSLRVQ